MLQLASVSISKGIYIGGGLIVHASNSKPYPSGGIKVSNAKYRTILSVRRIIK